MNQPIDTQIEHVLHNLLPKSGLENKFGAPQSLFDRMAFYHTPGVTIAVINNFALAWAQSFGVTNMQTKQPVTTETLFQAGSISKSIFALAVMRLVQEGRVDLDEDIQRYLTTWRVPVNGGWQPRLTLRQLLSHTAGLTVHGFPGYQSDEKLPSIAQILNGEAPANTPKVEVNILPGVQFRYSGGGTTVAQQLLVDLLQKPFPQIMRELVLEPLGLRHSTYEQPLPKVWATSAATAHPWKGIPLQGSHHIYPEMAAAGLWTTATDLAQVGVELLQVLHDKKMPTLVKKETILAMLQPQLKHQKAGDGEFAGLGFFCNGKEDEFHFGHGGWDEGFVAQMRFYPNVGKGAVVMINSNEGHPLLDEILRAIAVADEWPAALPKEKTPVILSNLHEYKGIYCSADGIQFQISVMEDNLLLHYGKQPPLAIFPASEVEFFNKAINADILFEKNEQAVVTALTMRQGGNNLKAEKQDEKNGT
ncbi:MAG: serine hydrolase domain-containing protein [Caldilineaceae bacterium]